MDNREKKRITFKQAAEGYDTQEVDHYVDLLSTRYELLHSRYQQLEAEHQRLITSYARASSALTGGALLPREGQAPMTVPYQAPEKEMLLIPDEHQAELLKQAASEYSMRRPTFAPIPEDSVAPTVTAAGSTAQAFETDTEANVEKNGSSGSTDEKKPRLVTRLVNLLFILVLGLLVLAALSFALSDNPNKSFFGYRWYWIQSGSMEPALPVGSLVVVKVVNPETLRVGDDVTFRTSQHGQVEYVTHRIVEVKPRELDQGYSFVTKGIANPLNDPDPRGAETVIGKVVAHMPYVGAALAWLRSNILWVGVLALLLFVLYLIFRSIMR